jgi:hypothetical protein
LARAALVSLGTGAVGLTPGCTLLPQDRSGGTLADDASSESGIDTSDDSGLVGTFYGSISGLIEDDSGSLVAAYGSISGMTVESQCTTVQDCRDMTQPTDTVCCVQEQCLFGANAMSVSCLDPEVQTIRASNYEQSCLADSDCIAIAEGNFCVPGASNCPNAAINKAGHGQYQSDVANTNAAFCSAPSSCGAALVCGASAGPWCLNGTCELQTCPPADAGSDGPTSGGEQADD